MNAISIGPLAFDGARFAAVIAILLFMAVTETLARRNERCGGRGDAAPWAFAALLVWIVGARIGFVWSNWSSFADRPLDIVKLWQGGFAARSGWVAAAVVVLAAMLAERKGVVRPIVLAGALAFVTHQAITATEPKPDLILPPMELLTLDGGTEQLAGRGKPVVLNLWATWCPPCRREMPMMTDLAASRPEVDFVFANQGETADRIRPFLMKEGLPFDDMLRDPRQRLMGKMRAIGLPSTLVFNANGQLVAAQMGEISQAALTDMIAKANGLE